MTFISLPQIGSLTLNAGSLLQSHPELIHHLAGHALAHMLFNHVRRSRHRRGLNRRQLRKISNRTRRRFVDNIILHHKRLHDHNRQIIISKARIRSLSKQKPTTKHHPSLTKDLSRDRDSNEFTSRYNSSSLKERGIALRGMVDARRLRARSRWLSVVGN